MKSKQKIHIIFLISLVVIMTTVIISYQIEENSQKLPAVVRAEKIFVSTIAEGSMGEYPITTMQTVEAGDVIAVLENTSLPFKLQTLLQKKDKYEALILSAKSGDQLTIEVNKLEEDILDNRLELSETELEIRAIIQKLEITEAITQNAERQFDAQKELFAKELISTTEFQSAADDFNDRTADYYQLRNDSLYAAHKIIKLNSIIDMLSSQKKMISNNVSLLASDYMFDLDKVNSEIFDLEEDIKNLTVKAPVSGVVTDINYRPGEEVDRGDVIAEIADLSNIWITAYGNSFSRHNIEVGNSVTIYCENGEKVFGEVSSVSPMMEKVKSLSSTFETTNAFAKVDVIFDDMQKAQQSLTPGERLFVRIKLKNR